MLYMGLGLITFELCPKSRFIRDFWGQIKRPPPIGITTDGGPEQKQHDGFMSVSEVALLHPHLYCIVSNLHQDNTLGLGIESEGCLTVSAYAAAQLPAVQ